MPFRPPAPALTRREWLAGIGATALLASCDSPVDSSTQAADTAGTDGDAAAAQADAPVALPDTASADAAAADAAADVTSADAATGGPTPIAHITSNDRYYVTSCCATPAVDPANWTLTITDRGTLLATLDLAFLMSLQPRDKEHTLECIGGGPQYQLISNAIWTGLPLLEIFAAKGIQVPSDVSQLKMTGLDGYGTGLPTTDLALPMWLVWRMNGQPLPPEHGYPARMLVPGRYGMKNPKWIKDIEFVAQPFTGFWEAQGWSASAYYLPNAYIRAPAPASTLSHGFIDVFGTAFAGRDPIVRVDVRIDGGPWQPTVLDYFGVQDVWTLWHFDWQATAGAHTVQARCTTASGATSDENPEGTGGLSGYNGSMAISVTVA